VCDISSPARYFIAKETATAKLRQQIVSDLPSSEFSDWVELIFVNNHFQISFIMFCCSLKTLNPVFGMER
jgi:hypothetical protein